MGRRGTGYWLACGHEHSDPRPHPCRVRPRGRIFLGTDARPGRNVRRRSCRASDPHLGRQSRAHRRHAGPGACRAAVGACDAADQPGRLPDTVGAGRRRHPAAVARRRHPDHLRHEIEGEDRRAGRRHRFHAGRLRGCAGPERAGRGAGHAHVGAGRQAPAGSVRLRRGRGARARARLHPEAAAAAHGRRRRGLGRCAPGQRGVRGGARPDRRRAARAARPAAGRA